MDEPTLFDEPWRAYWRNPVWLVWSPKHRYWNNFGNSFHSAGLAAGYMGQGCLVMLADVGEDGRVPPCFPVKPLSEFAEGDPYTLELSA